jgi:hypothetical protein
MLKPISESIELADLRPHSGVVFALGGFSGEGFLFITHD